MNRVTTIAILFLAASLEAGGDAIIRVGMHRSGTVARMVFFLLGAVALFAYGWTVNSPGWQFGRLLGLYVVFFFVMAQAISWIVFDQTPSPGVLAGGGLIISGGLVIVFCR
jgi:small multidrug resistance family-3 protein